jgi:hypothetical protein
MAWSSAVTTTVSAASPAENARLEHTRLTASPALARGLLAVVVLAAALTGFLGTAPDMTGQAIAAAGDDLTRLLRAMAMLKALMAAGAAAAIFWRLGAPVTPPWLAAYIAAAAAMAAGPGVIWGMAHVGLGALLLHGGLLAAVLLLWRDPAVSARLSAIVASRRAAIRMRG